MPSYRVFTIIVYISLRVSHVAAVFKLPAKRRHLLSYKVFSRREREKFLGENHGLLGQSYFRTMTSHYVQLKVNFVLVGDTILGFLKAVPKGLGNLKGVHCKFRRF